MVKPQPVFFNQILSDLSAEDLQLLSPLTAVDLPLRKKLETPNRPIKDVYFPESGMASVVANGPQGRGVEVGMIGWEGMSGLAVVMGNDRSPHETFMQVAGTGHSVSSNTLRTAIAESRSLHAVILRHSHDFVIQTNSTALANGRYTLEERLARWLLLSDDRTDEDTLTLTHEFLALMLGVRRAGVTVAINALEQRALIERSRRAIKIVDRDGLMEMCKGIYAPPKLIRRRAKAGDLETAG